MGSWLAIHGERDGLMIQKAYYKWVPPNGRGQICITSFLSDEPNSDPITLISSIIEGCMTQQYYLIILAPTKMWDFLCKDSSLCREEQPLMLFLACFDGLFVFFTRAACSIHHLTYSKMERMGFNFQASILYDLLSNISMLSSSTSCVVKYLLYS
jgi:hypothetical protein